MLCRDMKLYDVTMNYSLKVSYETVSWIMSDWMYVLPETRLSCEQAIHNSARHLKKVHTVWHQSLGELITNSPQEIVCVCICVCVCVCVFIRSCQTKEEVFFPVSASVCLCQTLCVRLAGHFDLVFEISGFRWGGKWKQSGMSVRQDKQIYCV